MKSLDAAQSAVGLSLLASGSAKLAGLADEQFEKWDFPMWFCRTAGGIEVAAAAGLLAGLRDDRCALAGSLLAGGTMAGAVWTHLVRAKDPPAYALPAGILLGLSCWIAARRAGEIRARRAKIARDRQQEILTRRLSARAYA